MFRKILLALFIIPAFFQFAAAQKLKKADKIILTNLETHIRFLADDKLEGRRAGTAGEKMASDYILLEFQKAGLQPRGQNSWLQPFEIDDGKQIVSSTHFSINNIELKLDKEYFPLAFSAVKNVEGLPAMALQENGVPYLVKPFEVAELISQARKLLQKASAAGSGTD